jgi:hypothetical protein
MPSKSIGAAYPAPDERISRTYTFNYILDLL